MAVVRDITIDQLTQAVIGISTNSMSDSTGQAINTTLGTLGKDTTLSNINTTLQSLVGSTSPSAANVTFDNTGTGLSASNVQSAISEICTDLIQTKTYTSSYTAGGNTSISITADDFGASIPSGYAPIGISDFASQNVNVVVRGIYGRATGTAGMMTLRNISSSSVTATAYITILYIKSLFI